MCVAIHIYVTDVSSYIKNAGQFSFFKYIVFKKCTTIDKIIIIKYVCYGRINIQFYCF